MANYGLNNQTNYVNKLTLRAFSRNFRELFELLPCSFSRKCSICMQRQSIPVTTLPPAHRSNRQAVMVCGMLVVVTDTDN